MKVNGKYRCLTRVPDNFFVGGNLGKVSTPLRVRLTSITGEQVETTIPKIDNDVNIQSNVQYKGIKNGSKYAESIYNKLKQITTATLTRMSLNERPNERNNSSALALFLWSFLCSLLQNNNVK